MKKKAFGILLTICLLAALAACGSDGPSGASQPPASPAGAEESAGYVFRSGQAEVAIDEDMADVLADLGEAQSYFEAASCAFDGLDKTYTYSGFSITTRPDGEKDYVQSILLTDDSAATPEGIYIGSAAADVTAAYGEGEQTDTLISYTQGNTALNFVLEDGVVVSIEYLPA